VNGAIQEYKLRFGSGGPLSTFPVFKLMTEELLEDYIRGKTDGVQVQPLVEISVSLADEFQQN
jgi:hypothetical protein